MVDLVALKYIGIGLCCIGLTGAAKSVAAIFSAFLDGVSRNPEAESKLFKGALIGAGLAEAMGLFAFLIAILLLFFG